ncbi:MAG: Trk system potassium transporter TrkA [Prevotellaceae bacterium]|jgi:trk system potassium uptake protein TrkA|nr:Trk system potassium transporter TrkA [Prevotellaceae bacterium]
MKIIIGGAGEVGSLLAELLSNERHQITVVEHDGERLRQVAGIADIITVEGLTTSIETLHRAHVERCDLYIAVSPAQEQDMNIVSAALAKRLGAKKAIARINNGEYLREENQALFSDMGIDYLFYPEKIAAREIADLLRQAYTDEIMDFSGEKLQLVVYKLEKGSPVIDRRLSDITGTMQALRYRVMAISRRGETIIPRGDCEFRLHDLVYVITERQGLDEAVSHSGRKDFDVHNVMILGGSRMAEMIAGKLERKLPNLKLIEPDRQRCRELAELLPHTLVINGDVHDTDLLEEEDLRRMDAFVAVSGNSATNILSCVVAKRLGVSKTIAEIEDMDYIKLAESMGVNTVINKKLITASRIFRFTKSHNVQSLKYLNGLDAELMEFIVKPGSAITKGKIRDVGFPKDAIIGGIIRGDAGIIAVGSSEIKAYDRVVVLALPSALPKVNRFFE